MSTTGPCGECGIGQPQDGSTEPSQWEKVETLVRQIHEAVKRRERTQDHGLIGNLRCILDHVLPSPPDMLDGGGVAGALPAIPGARMLAYELEGVVSDWQRTETVDFVGIETIKRVRDALYAAPVALPAIPEPFAYYIYIATEQRGELVHDLDDAIDDLTNCECEVTPLFR